MGEGARCGDVPAGIPPLHSRGITEEEGRASEQASSEWIDGLTDVHFGVIKVKLPDRRAVSECECELGYRFPLRRGLCLRRQQLNNRHHRGEVSPSDQLLVARRDRREPGASSSARAELE